MPDQIGLHRIERAGFGVESDQPGIGGAGDPGVERLQRLHAFISRQVDGGHFGQRLARRALHWCGPGIDRFGRVELGLALGAAAATAQPPQQAGEAVLFEERRQRFGRDRIQLEIVERDRQRAIFLQLHQHPAEPRHIRLLDQRIAQLARLHLRRGGQNAFKRAVLLDQLGRGLGPDAANAGNIVRRIAHQRQHIADQIGHDPELLGDFGQVDPHILHRVEHVDMAAARRVAADQLHQILVRGNNRHIPAARRRLAGIGGDHVVGLDVLFLDHRQREGAGGIANQRELGDQIFRRGRAIRLVLVINLVAKRGSGLVEHHRKVGRTVRLVEIVGKFPQHCRIAVDRANRGSLRVGKRRQTVIGAEDIGRSVDQIEVIFWLHCAILARLEASVSPSGSICPPWARCHTFDTFRR